MIDGIKYEKIGSKIYEMTLFNDTDLEIEIYFVAEIKSTGQELRGSEEMKIKCGKAHFEKLDHVAVSRIGELN